MDESLETAAKIRQELSDRRHSDSTELIRENPGPSNETLAERELTLENLVSSVTEANRHPETDSGPPIGEEEW